MEIIERKENPLLNRVEISFRWEHPKGATPKLSEMVAAAAKAEPGSKKELTFVKNVNTRFGLYYYEFDIFYVNYIDVHYYKLNHLC